MLSTNLLNDKTIFHAHEGDTCLLISSDRCKQYFLAANSVVVYVFLSDHLAFHVYCSG